MRRRRLRILWYIVVVKQRSLREGLKLNVRTGLRRLKRYAQNKVNRLRVCVLAVLGVGAAATTVVAVRCYEQSTGDLLLNLGTELVGAFVTYLLIGLVIGGREDEEAERTRREAEKADLIAQMGSQVNAVARAAAEELGHRDWLTDGSLRGKRLVKANLAGAHLAGASLEGAILLEADLTGADLRVAHLEGAILIGADLTGAILFTSDLTGAHLERANLKDAKVSDRQLAQAQSLQGATMPNGTVFEGTMEQFREWVTQGARQNGDEES